MESVSIHEIGKILHLTVLAAPILVWGIVPAGFEAFEKQETVSMIQGLENIWQILWSKGIDRDQMMARSMLSPATCCLVNPDKELTVDRAFSSVKQMSDRLREKYQLM